MRILVTGGAGFIGSNLVFSLLSGGHELGVIDDLSVGSMANLHPAAWFRRLDITDPALHDAVAEFRPEVVIHLAAQASVTVSQRDPERDRLVNVEGTRAVARAAAAAGVRRVLSASSAAVYGVPVSVPIGEADPKAPENPYGRSKLAAEQALADELRPAGVDFASLRFSNVYGPRQDWRGEGGVVAIFCGRMVSGEAPVVYGDGTQTRDFIYVGDVVFALLEAAETDATLALPGDDGPAYNISTGDETSVEMLVQHLRSPMGYFGSVEHAPAREGDVARSALGPQKAAEVFGWHSRVSLEAGLTRTAAWFTRPR
ncbi:MAG: NAD-dependent epimerase/dehydratase family protein [Coriobacteriia bacterium]|nr:NAD-dependent epimerase/dehydratase family protein [Coriobacteriia bacterium]